MTEGLPSEAQMAAAIRAVNRTHENYGYRRPLKDDYIERVIWAAWFAIELTSDGERAGGK